MTEKTTQIRQLLSPASMSDFVQASSFIRHSSFVIRHSALALILTLTLSAYAEPERIDLPTVLRLAGAQNLEIQLASEKVNEARAVEEGTLWAFFPWVVPGVGYRAHDGRIQSVEGNVFDVNK